MTVIDVNDLLTWARQQPTIEVDVRRGSLRTALAAVLPHVSEFYDRVRLHFVSDVVMVAIAARGSSVAIARIAVDGVRQLPELPVIDIESRSAREVLALLTPPRDKEARAQWVSESFRLTVTGEEVTFAEEGELLDGRSLTVPRLPHVNDEGKPTFPDFAAVVQRCLDQPPGVGVDDFAVGLDNLAAWIKTAKVYDAELEIAPRRSWKHTDRDRAVWTVRVAGDQVVGVVSLIHQEPDWVDGVSPLWSRMLAGIAGTIKEEP